MRRASKRALTRHKTTIMTAAFPPLLPQSAPPAPGSSVNTADPGTDSSFASVALLRRTLNSGARVIGAYTMLYVLWLIVRPGSKEVYSLVSNAVLLAGMVLPLPWCFAREKRAWGARQTGVWGASFLFGLATASWAVGQCVWMYYEHILHDPAPYPSLADAGFLGVYPFLLAAILRLHAQRRAAGRVRLILDGLVLLAAAVTFSWRFLLGPIMLQSEASLLGKCVGAAYPLADLVLMFCLFTLPFYGREGSGSGTLVRRVAVVLLSLGIAVVIITDTIYAYQALHNTYVSGTLLMAGWPLGYLLIGLGARVLRLVAAESSGEGATKGKRRDVDVVHEAPFFWHSLLSQLLLSAVGVLVVGVARSHHENQYDFGVYLGACVLLSLTLARQVVLTLENSGLYHSLRMALQDLEKVNRQIRGHITTIQQTEERFRLIVETALDAVIGMDAAGTITGWNAQAESIFGWSRDEAIGRSLAQTIIPPGYQEAHQRSLTHFLAAGEARILGQRIEVEALHRDGHTFPAELSVSPIGLSGDGEMSFSGFVRDITHRKKAEETIRHQAHHDALTGLPNRALFTDRLDQALAHARRAEQNVAVLFLDLDRFKIVNDTLGHASGDRLLIQVACRLRDCLRAEDTLARMGGDEFTVILPGVPASTGGEAAVQVAENLLAALAAPILLDGHELRVTVSIGISLFPHDGENAETLLKHADVAMYRAKEKGRSGYQLFTESMNVSALERLTLEADLRRALERDEFCLFYQPQFSANEEHIVGVEALVRWRHPTRGLVSPATFIPLAEETGLIVPLGDWVLEEACRQAAVWQAERRPLRVSVNVAARQLQRPDFAHYVAQTLAQAGLSPCWLDLELTESVLIENAVQARGTLRALRAQGLRVSVDDSGTGYSSLSYLRLFPLDVLKIDRAFVRDLTRDAADQAVVRALIDLAHGLNLEVVAEGVETSDQRDCLSALGCDVFQGFLFSAPVPLADLESLLPPPRALSGGNTLSEAGTAILLARAA